MLLRCIFSCFLLLIASCSSKSNEYEIGMDPTFAPLNFAQRQKNVVGFSTELLRLVSLERKTSIGLLQVNWDVLLDGLKEKKYTAIISSIYPYNFNEEIYSFSEVFLKTGPVLVLPIDAKQTTLDQIKNKAIGALAGSPEVLLLEKYPGFAISTYDTISEALNDLVGGTIQAALLPVLPTSAYVNDLYMRKLKVASQPLTDEGLRLITLKDKGGKLLKDFNKTLKHLQKNGEYEKLLEKWELASSSKS